MMKFNPEEWQEVKSGEKIDVSQGRLRLRLTQESPVLVTSNSGVETLVSVDKEIDVEVTDSSYATFENPKARGWVYVQPDNAYVPEGEVFTNADRMPHESGSVSEVTAALRLFRLEQRAILNAAREERAEIDRDIELARAQRDALVAPPAPAPVQVDDPAPADPAPAPRAKT